MTRNEGERLAGLEAKVDVVIKDLSDLKNNHLPHIEKWLRNLTLWIIGLLVSINLILVASYITLWAKKP